MAFASKSITFQVTSGPAYIAALSAYQAAQMSGSLAPENGTTTMQSITPTEWINSDPGTSNGLRGIIIAWSGGGKARHGTKVIAHGGGHNDSANNGVYTFDFNGTTRPTGWVTPLDVSAVSAVRSANATYSDGRPTSIHGYDGTVHASHDDCLYRFCGAWFNSSGGTYAGAAKYNLASKAWTILASYPGSVGDGSGCFYDPVTRKIAVIQDSRTDLYFYRCDDNTWSGVKSTSHPYTFQSSTAWDTTRGRGIMVGGGVARQFNINFSAETVTSQAISPSGATECLSGYAASPIYDSVADCFWLYGGAGSKNWQTLYRMHPTTFAITANTITGATVQRDTLQNCSFGRILLMESFRALGVITAIDQAPYVIKLPAS